MEHFPLPPRHAAITEVIRRRVALQVHADALMRMTAQPGMADDVNASDAQVINMVNAMRHARADLLTINEVGPVQPPIV